MKQITKSEVTKRLEAGEHPLILSREKWRRCYEKKRAKWEIETCALCSVHMGEYGCSETCPFMKWLDDGSGFFVRCARGYHRSKRTDYDALLLAFDLMVEVEGLSHLEDKFDRGEL